MKEKSKGKKLLWERGLFEKIEAESEAKTD